MGNWISFTVHILYDYCCMIWTVDMTGLIGLLQIWVWYNGAQMSISSLTLQEPKNNHGFKLQNTTLRSIWEEPIVIFLYKQGLWKADQYVKRSKIKKHIVEIMVVNVKVQFISISTKADICKARYLSVKCSLQNASTPFKKFYWYEQQMFPEKNLSMIEMI